MPEISIIVPVYKVEQYLERCVKSILGQTFKDFELILVDDGSPDKCPILCDEWKQKDERIRVIHKENGGLSSARNAGLKISRGKYIGFVDSDDWIAEDMYELLYGLLKKYDADYAGSEMLISKEEGRTFEQPVYKEKVMNREELLKVFFRVSKEDIHYCVCDKLFKKEILKGITFWEGMRFEDIDFNFKVLQKCKIGVYTNQIKYFWYYNESGITRNGLVSADMQLLEIWKNVMSICERKYPEYTYFARMNYERAFMGILGKAVKFGVSESYIEWKKDRNYLLKYLRRYYADLIKWKMPLSRKLLLCGLCLSPEIVAIPFRLKWR